MVELADLHTVEDVIAATELSLESHLWDFAFAGAGEGASRRLGRAAFGKLSLVPRVLRAVGVPSMDTTVLGLELDLPILLAPVGSLARFHPDGATAVARAAGQLGALGTMGGLAHPAMETVMAQAVGPMMFQMYIAGGQAWRAELVARVEAAGFSALCITVDSVAPAFSDAMRRHGWAPATGADHPNLLGATDRDLVEHMARYTWDDLADTVAMTSLPVVLKGVLSPQDAELAVRAGVSAVYVSNHGGLVLDYAVASIDVLPDVVDAVSGRAEVLFDSGVRRGTDVAKALAYGADGVGIGALLCCGIALGGTDGIVRIVEIVTEELRATMAMVGASCVAELEPGMITRNPGCPRDNEHLSM